MKCIRLLTFIPLEQIEKIDRWDEGRINEKKELLAYELTAMIHGKEEADKAQATAKSLFGGAGDDANMPSTEISESNLIDNGISVIDLLVLGNLAKSKSEARRLIEQGGINCNGEKVTDLTAAVSKEQLTDGVKIRKGKKIYHKFLI